MGNTAIGYASPAQMARLRTELPRHTCCLCNKVYAIKEPGLFIFTGGGDITFCYQHLVEMVNKNDTYLPAVPLKMERFNLDDFLNAVRKNLENRSPKSSKTKRTIRLLRNFLEKTGLINKVKDPTESQG